MKMLLDPFEEQFDVPALSVEFCDCQGFVSQKVGKEAVDLTGSEVFICDHSESLGIAPGWLDSCKFDDLIADYTCFGVTSSGLNNFVQHVVLCPCYEECSVLVDVVEESEEINITFVQKIDGSHLDTETVQSLDIVHRGICKVDIDRKIPPEIKERMHLDTCLSRSESGPRTELQTETYGAAVKGIYHIVNIEPEWIFRIQRTDSPDKSLSKVTVDTPVPLFICLGKSVPWNSVTDTAMIQFMLDSNEAGLNVAKTVLRSILRKAHHEKLIVTGKVPGTIISLVSGDTSIEVSARYERHKLSKYGFPCEHRLTDKMVSPKLRFKSCTRKNLCN